MEEKMPKVNFILAVHCHQPLGNFDHVFESSYVYCYHPFLQLLKEHSSIPIGLHFSGILWDWLEKHNPQLLDIVAEMVEKGQVELLTGGYYEPILPILIDSDKHGQIEKLSSYLQRRFGYRPRGIWLAERVWEPYLAKPLAEAGLEYVIVDDYHFKAVGFDDEKLRGYYITEEQGCFIKVFPISKELRYLIPFAEPEKTIEFLRAQKKGGLVVMADDGEKFGVWPGTHEWVYERGWLHRFFSLLEENQDWLHMDTFSGMMNMKRPEGRVYLPAASYEEMTEWALPSWAVKEYEEAINQVEELPSPESVRRFLRGGYWRNFLVKYPESNHLHKRVLAAGKKLSLLREEIQKGHPKGEECIPQAQELLWQAQCNDAYWHGIFGGLYLPHLRRALYNSLIRAEGLMDELRHYGEKTWIELNKWDLDGDGFEEVSLSNPLLYLLFSLREGGSLVELDYRPKAYNLMDTLARRPEGYHFKVAKKHELSKEEVKTIHVDHAPKEEGLDTLLHYDWYRRASFLDHFLGPSADLEGFRRSTYEEIGDFINQPYQAVFQENGQLELYRKGHLWVHGDPIPLEIRKRVTLGSATSTFKANYRILYQGHDNDYRPPFKGRFGVEFNLAFSASKGEDRYMETGNKNRERIGLVSFGESLKVDRVRFVDGWLGLEVMLAFDRPATLWRFPLETVSQSESGYEKVYQGTVILAWWEVELEHGKPLELWIELGLRGDKSGNHFV